MTQALNLANFANTLNSSGQTNNSGLQNPSVTVNTSTGLSGGGAVSLGGSLTLTNTAPDQVVSLTAGNNIAVSGTYPNFTISSNITSGSPINTNTGATSYLFSGIPSGVKKITFMLDSVSTSGTSPIQIQLGSGSLASTGYFALCEVTSTTAQSVSSTSGFPITFPTSDVELVYGSVTICLLTGNTWVESGVTMRLVGTPYGTYQSAGKVGLSGVLDRLALTTINGTDTFDGGTINILME